MGGAAKTVSKWIPNEIKKAIPNEISKAIPKEISGVVGLAVPILGTAALKNVDTIAREEQQAKDDYNKAVADQQAKLFQIQHPNIVGQVTLGNEPTTSFSTSMDGSQQAVGQSPQTFSSPTQMSRVGQSSVKRPGGAGAALAQQAQDQSSFRLPTISNLTFGGS
jgi:hypothetical protein